MSNLTDQLGTKLGPRIAQLLTQASTAAFAQRAPVEHDLRVNSTRTVVDWAGLEFGSMQFPLVEPILRTATLPEPVRQVLLNSTSGKNQWQAFAGIAFGASGVGSALQTIMSNYLAPTVYTSVEADPLLLPDIGTVVQLFARGVITDADYRYGMRGQGIKNHWADAMVEAARIRPDLTTLISLMLRGVLSADQVTTELTLAGYHPETATWLLEMAKTPLSVPDAALALLRGNISAGRAEEAARIAGVSGEDFQTIVDNTGEPPAVEALLGLWRRGVLSDAKLEQGIRQSRVRDEWIEDIKRMGVQAPSAAEVLDAYLKGQISEETARSRWAQGGGDPSWFTDAYNANGAAPTPDQLVVMANRGVIPWEGTGPGVTSYAQGFLEGPWRNKWAKAFRDVSAYLPPPRTVTALLNSGAITVDQAADLLRKQGLPEVLVTAYTTDSHHTKTAKSRDLAVGTIETLYRDKAIAQLDAHDMLTGLGYDATDADFILAVVDLQRVQKYTEAVITTVHSRYTGYYIDRSTASAELDALQVASDQRDDLLTLWDMERSVRTKRLTEAQIVSAFKKGILTQDEAFQMLTDQGYPDREATILMILAGAKSAEPTVPNPSASTG